ncbi:hypothetical protein ABE441_17605 [Alcaligenes aquatilis]|uniref:hypothetical protein n=1 Tax=Alcaligenes aquatilis TaxID=323284 RepID=UPI003207D41E
MSRPLPYPGYTWSFTQHAAGFNAQTVYDFLKCVAPFEGEVADYDNKITALMIASGVLTPNRRDGVADAWRDYQQLLVELGLIYSTKICRALTITELGHIFLAGEIGFSELVGIQALRYQYPNGQKSTIQNRLREALAGTSIALPSTLTELQVNHQILIKPGLLILRVLLELYEAGYAPEITLLECQSYLLPCKQNSEWPLAFSEIIAQRNSTSDISDVNRHARRNIQDWFKLLKKSDFFEGANSGILLLNDFALQNIDLLKKQCDTQENYRTFWIPTEFDIQARLSWFSWFGHIPYSSQELLVSDVLGNRDYVKNNFVAGMEDITDGDSVITMSNIGMNLQPIDLQSLERDTPFNFPMDMAELAAALRRGAQKRHAKTLLHDRIVKQLAQDYIAQGANVFSDPDSIDLLAEWPDGSAAIFEVKTVTRRSLQARLRAAIGQVEEYAYRRHCAGSPTADRVIVINTEVDNAAWQRSFLTEHLKIGLICTTTTSYSSYSPDGALARHYWANARGTQ